MSVREGLARPLRNRVTPFGTIVADPARGTLMGNRGRLHDDQGRILRASDNRAWISCVLDWPGVRREVMSRHSYTELFFRDEPTALAAGHRPCGQCRGEQLGAFKQAWQRAYGLNHPPTALEMDAVLGRERRAPRARVALDHLPDGAMVTNEAASAAWLVWGGSRWRWSMTGYVAEHHPSPAFYALTPPSILRVLGGGYTIAGRPELPTESQRLNARE